MKIPAGGSKPFTFKFKPTRIGYHKLVIKYNNDAGANAETTLEGIGTMPMVETNDLEFEEMIVGDTPKDPIDGKLVRFTNVNYGSEADNLTITSLVNLGINDNATYSDQGFMYNATTIVDQAGAAVTFPIVLEPGEYIEFSGKFNAPNSGNYEGTITSVSDAAVVNPATKAITEENGNVLSTWYAKGLLQGVGIDGDEATVCLNVPEILDVKVTNTETTPVEVTSVTLDPAMPQFTIIGPTTFTLDPSNPVQNVQVRYVSPVPGTFSTTVVVSNSSLKTPELRAMIEGTTVGYNETSSSKTSPDEQIIGGTFEHIVTLNMNEDPLLSAVRALDVVIKYKSEWMTADINTLALGKDFVGKFTIASKEKKVITTDGTEEIHVRLTTTDKLSGSGAKEMLKLGFKIYLPARIEGNGSAIDRDKLVTIAHTIATDDACVVVAGAATNIKIKDVCISDMRNIVLSKTQYSLAEVSPNPVSSQGGEINFSVGLEAMTEIRIINAAGEAVAVPVSGVMKPGEYSTRIPIESLTSGIYFYEMTSGPFREMKKLVIQK